MGCLVAFIGFIVGLRLILNHSLWGVVIWIVTPILFVVIDNKRKKKREDARLEVSIKEKDNVQKRIVDKGFIPSQVFQDAMDFNKYIAFDEEKKMILFVEAKGESIHAYGYGDILQSKALEDGREVLDTTRNSATSGALIGGAIAGGLGAVVGGISGTQADKSRKSVSVKIVVNDTKDPSFELEFLHKDLHESVYKDSDKYKNAYKLAQSLHDKVSVLIRQAEEMGVQVKQEKLLQEIGVKGEPSIADEIRKLAELRAEGIITDGEFESQKKRLMV